VRIAVLTKLRHPCCARSSFEPGFGYCSRVTALGCS